LCFLVVTWLAGGRVPALAQVPSETSGTRALGMAGAFVAVADDSSATSWNPAGIATLRFFDATLDWHAVDHEESTGGVAPPGTGWEARTSRFAVALPVVAFSFERSRLLEVRTVAAAGPEPAREDQPQESLARALRMWHVGLTLAQSLGDSVVVGSTLRLVRAGASGARLVSPGTVDEGLEQAEMFDVSSATHFDADIGVLAWISRLRLGLVVRHLTEPDVGAAEAGVWRLDRQVRLGAAWGGEPVYGQRPWVVAVDADLTTTDLPEGERRSLAAGAERWWADRRLGVRGGARMQTVGGARPAASGGVSVAVRSGMLIEAQATGGASDADRGWSLGARVTF
jgi:hypothetical protein